MHSDGLLVPLLVVGVSSLLFVAWILWRGAATRASHELPPEPVSLLVAEYLVRRARYVHVVVVLVSTAIVAGGVVSAAYAVLAWIGVFAVHVDGIFKTHRAATLLAVSAAGAELRGTRLWIGAHGAHAILVVSRRSVRAAKSHALPTSIAR